jgi:hypothetical protein
MKTHAYSLWGVEKLASLRWSTVVKPFIAMVLALWFGLVFLLGANGVFDRPRGEPPLPILLGFTAPLVGFIVAYVSSTTFRTLVLATDLPLLTATQAWRAGGLGFLALHAHRILPGLFAWPAGLGDIAIGVTAPWVALALIRRPTFEVSVHSRSGISSESWISSSPSA